MNYRILVLLVLLLSISLYSIKTGWISSDTLENMYVTVVSTQVDLTVNVPDPASGLGYYCSGEFVNVNNTLVSTGNINATGNLSSWILNTSSDQVHYDSWNEIDLSVGESKNYTTSYEIADDPDTGTYTAEGNFSYDGKFSYSSDTFVVRKGIGNLLSPTFSISQTIPAGNFSDTEEIQFSLQYACENVIVTFNTTPGPPGDWVTFIPDEVFVSYAGPGNSTIVNISVPQNTDVGIYNGTISVYANGQWQLNISLRVEVTGLIFSMNVTIPSGKKQVCKGEEVPAIIDISTNQPGLLDINMTFQIRNFTGYVFSEYNTPEQINNSLQIIQTLTAPSVLGDYTFLSILQHNSTNVTASDTFRVIECIPPPPPPPTPPPPSPPLPVYALILRLSTNILTVIRGNRTSFIAFINNTGTAEAGGIRISVDGIPLNWIEIIPMETSIPAGEIKEFLVFVNVPEDADVGTRRLEVKAKNKVESNVEVLTLVIGRDPKEIANLLLLELERVRALANASLVVGECIDISMIESYYEDAELARERGLKEYDLGNFVQTSNWFEYAIPVYIKVQRLIDITLEVEIERLRSTKFIAPPTFDQEREYRIAKSYLEEKNYRKICEPISKMRMVTMTGLIFWPILIIIVIVLIIIAVILYKKKRRIERRIILERVKKRLESTETSHEHLYPRFTRFRKIKNLLKIRKERSD